MNRNYLECGTARVRQAWGLVRTEQGPAPVCLHALHEEVGDPQSIEEVAAS